MSAAVAYAAAALQLSAPAFGFDLMTFLKRFMNDRSGATAVEYALLCALIGIAMMAAMSGVSGAIASAFTKVANAQPV